MTSTPTAPTGGLPATPPTVNPETATFWEATHQGRLLLTQCPSCDTVIWYPKAICVSCGGTPTAWIEASGRGTIYSFTITRRGQGPFSGASPYVLAYVELDEGPRIFTNIVDGDPESLSIGQVVEVVFHDTGEGSALPRFRPA
jgi:uncharacterized OB-fold protein